MRKGEKEGAISVWGLSPAGSAYAGGKTAGTKEYFEKVKAKRNGYEIPWLFELIPFSSFRGRSVLELGCGAGYDAFEFCRHGANYTGIDIAAQNLLLTKKHLGYFGYNPSVIRGDVENLPLKDENFDVVFSNGVLHHTPDTEGSLLDANRVLKTKGELWVIVYHKNSIFYWLKLFFLDHLLRLGFLTRSFRERLSMIEYSTSTELPLVKAYSRRKVAEMLSSSGFTVTGVWVRKLLTEDLPDVPIVRKLWQFIPPDWLDRLGRVFGWYVIGNGEKK
jgi:ubiquinone/menaquinone biosynthesis C-methylase UbiE